MLEIYLKENDSNMIRFPVTPSEVSCETSANISTDWHTKGRQEQYLPSIFNKKGILAAKYAHNIN